MEDTTVAETDSPYLTAEEASRIHGLSQPAALCEFLITHNNAISIKTLCETFLSGKTFLGLRDADFVSLGMTNVFAKRWLLNAIESASSPAENANNIGTTLRNPNDASQNLTGTYVFNHNTFMFMFFKCKKTQLSYTATIRVCACTSSTASILDRIKRPVRKCDVACF